MLNILIDLNTVRESGRLDFDFYNPSQEKQINLVKGYTKEILGNLCIKVGTGKTASRGSYPESGVRIVKVKNIRGSGINWNYKFFISEEFYKSAEKKARNEQPRSKLRGINPNLVNSFAASGGEFDPKRFKRAIFLCCVPPTTRATLVE